MTTTSTFLNAEPGQLDRLADAWWLVALRGVAAILFGILAIFWPGPTLLVLVLLFGIYAIVDGVFAIVSGVRGGEAGRRDWFLVVRGIAGILAGLIALAWPEISALALLIVIAAWAIVTGVVDIMAAYRLRHEIRGEWLLALGGIASIAFGVLLVLFPGAGALAVVWLIGAYAIVAGVLWLLLAWRLRERQHARQASLRTSYESRTR